MVDEHTKEISLSINELPIKGKANRAIIKMISRYFRVKPTNVKIIRGLSSRTKVVEIS